MYVISTELLHPFRTKFLLSPTKSQFNPIKKIKKMSFLAADIESPKTLGEKEQQLYIET